MCVRVFEPTEQGVVRCRGCRYMVHVGCDPHAAYALSARAPCAYELYVCPSCRGKLSASAEGDTWLAIVTCMEAQLRQSKPKRPPTGGFGYFSAIIARDNSGAAGLGALALAKGTVIVWQQMNAAQQQQYEAAAEQAVRKYIADREAYDQRLRECVPALVDRGTFVERACVNTHPQVCWQPEPHFRADDGTVLPCCLLLASGARGASSRQPLRQLS